MEPVSVKVKFAMVPAGLIAAAHERRVSYQALALYATIARYVDFEDRNGWPGMERLAGEMGVSEATLKRWMAELVREGWAHRKRRHGTSSLTHLCMWEGEPAPWDQSAHQRAEPMDQSAHPRADQSAHPRAVHGNETQRTRPRPPTRSWSEEARAVAKAVYDAFEAAERPHTAASGFRGYAAVAQQLLDAGYQPAAVEAAMRAAPVCTSAAVMLQINRRKDGSNVASITPDVLDAVYGKEGTE
jgi:hypothetical protein